MPFNRVSSNKLYIQIYEQILHEIEIGTFQVGDKLPSEKLLCNQFGVSRAPVRQAISALELNGFVLSKQGEGAYVKNTMNTSKDNDSSNVLNSVSPEEIIESRMEIEPIIAKYAAQRATNEVIEKLNNIISKMEKETNDGIYNPITDDEFHQTIAKATKNDLLIKFIQDISDSMGHQKMWKFLRDRTVTRSDYRQVNFEEHKKIIQAIELHDDVKASELMTLHMNNLFERYWKK
ncbi:MULTISPECIES: FadR/GntR family transcriptional regulator [Staphylococcus]|uniref:FadR/GntR family transcriptional regulator n=1 Tax=Staphylococcus TaxID=1279 RepID=UPI000D1F17C6|nr:MULTISPECIES: FadR/GntR family transcriptional regulator [Staphylococcus]PTK47042.1 transcriptional regulator [Staphylococcus saprophyticus]RIN41875.1 FadR family transcriptional regulator [Staphylococcus succinus]